MEFLKVLILLHQGFKVELPPSSESEAELDIDEHEVGGGKYKNK